MSNPSPDGTAQQPGPTDVTLEDALAELTAINGENGQQLAVARVKIRKLEALVANLQNELGKDVKETD